MGLCGIVLEIDQEEAEVVRELFVRTANEGYSSYALADMLENRSLRTHSGARFTSTHILRILRHEGYTGYIITQNACSEHIPELQIVDKDLFDRAGKMVDARCTANAEARRIAQRSDNQTLLAGLVYCAHCGARMSGFMHKDRYRRRDGTMTEVLKPKYNCFQRAQHLRDSERALQRYEDEVLKCLEGRSQFSQEMLSRLIAKAEGDLRNARQAYAAITTQLEDEKETARKIKMCYAQFCGWAEEFELASLPRKRMILAQLIDKVEVGRGYDVTVRLNMSYRRFFDLTQSDEKGKITQAEIKNGKVA